MQQFVLILSAIREFGFVGFILVCSKSRIVLLFRNRIFGKVFVQLAASFSHSL